MAVRNNMAVMRRILLLFSALCAVITPVPAQQGTPAGAQRIVARNGAPPAAGCVAAIDVGKVYARRDAAGAGATLYVCANTAVSTFEWELVGTGGSGSTIVSVKSYGAVGDGVTNDTTAVQAAFTAACHPTTPTGAVYFPAGIYKVTSAITCDLGTTENGLYVYGDGQQSILRAGGATNGALQIQGSLAVTLDGVFVENMRIDSATSGTAAFGLKFIGVAGFGITNVSVAGESKMTDAIYLVGSQQGYIKGGLIDRSTTGIRLERAAYSGANAVEISGTTIQPIVASSACVVVDGADDGFYHSNHCVSSVYGVRVTRGGSGMYRIVGNHFELNSTAAIQTETTFTGVGLWISQNSFYNASPADELNFTNGTARIYVVQNMLNGDTIFGANCLSCQFVGNIVFGTITNNATGLQAYGNITNAEASPFSSGSGFPTTWLDPISINPGAGLTAGDIATFIGNPVTSGNWGIRIEGAGTSKDVYVQLNDAVVTGSTDSGQILIKSGPGGTTWAKFTGSQTDLPFHILNTSGTMTIGNTSNGRANFGMNYNTLTGGIVNNALQAFELASSPGGGDNTWVLRRFDTAGVLVRNEIQIGTDGSTNLPVKVAVPRAELTGFTFAGLPAASDGTVAWCSDCTKTITCAGSGSGAFAYRVGSAWTCSDNGPTGTAALDFGSINDGACAALTVTVTGAATGNALAPIWPSALNTGLFGTMLVTSANTVEVRLCNLSGAAVDPASLTYGATVVK